MKKNNEYLLEIVGVSKSFPGVKALDNVQLKVKAGTVHSLMGENGAGKSTLMKCLFGIYERDCGDIFFNNKPIKFANAKQALENGVAMVQQELNQAHKMRVMDNLFLGRFPTKCGYILESKMYNDSLAIFKKLGIEIDPKAILSTLSVSERQMCEIAKAVSYDAKIVVFDEPTSSLTDVEIKHLFTIIEQLKKQGCGIIYISHKMDEILKISDQVTIMRDGKYVQTSDAKDLTVDLIIKAMVGRSLENRFPPKDNKVGKVALQIKNLSSKYGNNAIRDVTLNVKKGEILGLAGLVGSGRSELLETIYGYRTRGSGEVYLNGKLVNNKMPKEAIANGFALLTEERRATGIFGPLSIKENAVIANLKKYICSYGLSNSKMNEDIKWVVDSMKVKAPTYETKIKSLSGGNQQKVIIGRWLLTQPDVLLLDEPTRGIDVGAKYEIYQLIINLAKQGKTIIMCNSELPEILGICDRIAVMSNYRLAGVLDNTPDVTQEHIMDLAFKYM